jgi:flagellar basal body-associated protein FliL
MAKKKGSPWTIIIVALLTFIAGIVFMAWYGEKLLPPPVPKRRRGKVTRGREKED